MNERDTKTGIYTCSKCGYTTKEEDTDHCCGCNIPYVPTLKQVTVCPCGCGYGYCEINEKWYSPEEIKQLKEMK